MSRLWETVHNATRERRSIDRERLTILFEKPGGGDKERRFEVFKQTVMPSLKFKGKQFVYSHHLSVPFRGRNRPT